MAGILDIFEKVTVLEPFATVLEKATVLDFVVDVKDKKIVIQLASGELVSKAQLYEFVDRAEKIYDLNELDIKIKYQGLSFSNEYYQNLLVTLFRKKGIFRAFLSSSEAELTYDTLKITNIKSGKEVLEANNLSREIKDIVSFELDKDIEVLIDAESVDVNEYLRHKMERQSEIDKKAQRPREVILVKEETIETEEKKSGLILGKTIKEEVIPMLNIRSGMGICAVSGEVLSVDSREIVKDGKLMYIAVNFDLGDDTWAISCEAFGKAELLKTAKASVKEGSVLKVRGVYEYDGRANQEKMKVLSIEALEKEKPRMDFADEKRVELHLHTKMSAKDAITSAKDLINCAASWGHRAIAITDHGVVQAFPEAFSAVKDLKKQGLDFKVIYGTEGYFVNDLPVGVDCIKRSYKDETIVFVDTKEAEQGKYLLAGVKIMDGEAVDDFYKEISLKKEDEKASIAALNFLNFCGENTVAAYNAQVTLDIIKTIREVFAPSEEEKTKNIIDIASLAKEFFEEKGEISAEEAFERLGIKVKDTVSPKHRVDGLKTAYIKMMEKIEKENCALSDEYTIDKNSEYLKAPYNHIIILAKNKTGLKNMYKLISKSNLLYFHKRPRIPKSVLSKYREGLIIGSACEAGELYTAIRQNRPQEEIEKIAAFYDYLEIQPIGNNAFLVRQGEVQSFEELKELNKKVVELGKKLGKLVVATCDVHFKEKKDELYRRVLQGAQGYDDAEEQAPLYFRTTEEMLEEFSYLGKETAYEVVVTNSNKIADMIEDIEPLRSGTYNPNIENCEQDLEDMCRACAHRVYGENLPKIVEDRMNRELDCILKYGFAVMYMIAHKLVKKSNDAGYLVGSRGSVGSSFVAYLAGITEVNALCPHYICPDCKNSIFFENGEYNIGIDMPDKDCPHCGAKMKKDGFNIPFETFLGFEGDKVPDIDLNFSGEYQATAHKYVGELFGDAFVFKAGTIGTIADKTAIGFYGKKYYEKKGIVPTQAELKRVSKGLVDIKNTTGQHPGGIIVCPKTMDIHDFCPVQHPADKKDSGIITTHFDFHSIHDNLLKLDILGHDDPSTIRMLETLTGVDATQIPLDDEKTMSIFSGTDAINVKPEQIQSKVGTFGVPEFGTSFTRQMLLDTLPTTFYELVLIAGLSHGTDVWLGNAQDLIKSGTATLSEVIGVRDDIMTYLIKKGLEPRTAFKIMEYVRKGNAAKNGMPEDFDKALRENNVPDWYIESCKKIKYMFPKAHAAAYVMMAFRVAYFKVHYPLEFYIAYFTVRADLFDAAIMAKGDDVLMNEMRKLEQRQNDWSATEKSLYTICEVCHEMYQRGLEFLPADLYESDAFKFQRVDGKIRIPLNAFLGVGDAAAQNIQEKRADGPFMSIDDLKNRAKLTKTVIETLKENGCLDGLPETNQISLFDGI